MPRAKIVFGWLIWGASYHYGPANQSEGIWMKRIFPINHVGMLGEIGLSRLVSQPCRNVGGDRPEPAYLCLFKVCTFDRMQ